MTTERYTLFTGAVCAGRGRETRALLKDASHYRAGVKGAYVLRKMYNVSEKTTLRGDGDRVYGSGR